MRGETIAIVGANRPKLYWSVMAAHMLGADPVPVYADAVAEELSYVLAHAETRFAAIEDQEQIDKIQSVIDRLPKLENMVYRDTRRLRHSDHAARRSMRVVLQDDRQARAQSAACTSPPAGRPPRHGPRCRQYVPGPGLRPFLHPQAGCAGTLYASLRRPHHVHCRTGAARIPDL